MMDAEMDRSTIQARIDRGLDLAAGKLGGSFQQYRPQTPLQPLAPPPIATLQGAAVRDAGFSLHAPPGFADAARYWLGDASPLQPGDLLVGDGAALFVASCPALTPALLVDCNASLQLLDWQPGGGYGGASEAAIATGWPASLRLAGRGQLPAAALPGDLRNAGWEMLLPAIPGLTLREGMRAEDAAGRRFVLCGVESTTLGLRIQAEYSGS
jgi:hypothetical protein